MDQNTIKLVLAGPVGAGKTTTIRSITDSDPVSTEMPLSDGAMGDKTTTTVAMDFSTATMEDGSTLLVYGMPGQERFSFMRSILMEGAFGVAVILNGRDADVAEQCEYWMKSIVDIDASMPMAIGITHTDLVPQFSLAPIREAMRRTGTIVPTFTFDARDRAQAVHLIRALIAAMR